MSIRNSFLALAACCFAAAGCVTENNATTETAETALLGGGGGGGWECENLVSVLSCVGPIGGLVGDINIDLSNVVGDVSVLDGAEVSNILNNLAIGSGNELNISKLLGDFELALLQKFLNDFNIIVEDNDVDICVLPLLGGLCCS